MGNEIPVVAAAPASGKRRYLITNVCYGDMYFPIFTELHLPSLLDPTNIPAHKERMSYYVFSDAETAPKIGTHPNYKRLKELLGDECQIIIFDWDKGAPFEVAPGEFAQRPAPSPVVKFNSRYSILIQMFKESVGIALKKNAYLSAIVADLVVAKNFIPNLLDKMDKGHGAVFMLPLRSAAEAVAPQLLQHFQKSKGETLEAIDLFNLTYAALHPLWTHCHWDNILFTRLPFALLWNSGTGLLARSFSVTPIIFEPTVHMLSAKQVIDVEIPAHCQNVYWCEDWTDAPVVGVEPLVCYYPPFGHKPSSIETVGLWAQQTLHPTQFGHLEKKLYFPSKAIAACSEELEKRADKVVAGIGDYGGHLV